MDPGSRWSKQTVWDGVLLALLLVVIFTAETFDDARSDIHSLAEAGRTDAAHRVTPDLLGPVWLVVLLLGGWFGCRMVRRFLVVADVLEEGHDHGFMARLRARLRVFAWASLVLWLLWQALGIAVVLHQYWLPSRLLLVLHVIVVLTVVLTLALGGSVVGDATLGVGAALVRVQLAFLTVLFFVCFRASFLSDQMTDVLRGWGDGPFSRPVFGLAAALLLGAVVRASASRLLFSHSAGRTGLHARLAAGVRAVGVPRWISVVVPVAAGIALIGLDVRGLGIAVIAVVILALATYETPTQRSAAAVPHAGLRRLAGTMGVVPVGILLASLTEATVNSLLLPSGVTDTDLGLIACASGVVAAFALLAAHAQVVVGDPLKVTERVPGEVVGLAGFLIGWLTSWSATVAAILLLLLAVVLASRVLGERGAAELWAAWGAGLGVAVAVYADPIGAPRGIGGFAVALLGATAILALLHPVASLAARRRLHWIGWRTPAMLSLVLWALAAWWQAPERRNQIATVAAEAPATTLEKTVDDWLDEQARRPVGEGSTYVPMLLVAASGGGSKAAYWTDLVLDCAFGGEVPDETADECPASAEAERRYGRLFLTSSVSGGSIGVYHLLRHADRIGRDAEWVRDSAGNEVLSPLLAWGLFHDVPTFLAGLPTDPSRCDDALSCPRDADRALVQLAAVAADDAGRKAITSSSGGLLAQHDGPLTVFNTAQVPSWDPAGLSPRRRLVLARVPLAEPAASCDPGGEQPLRDAIDGHDLLGVGQDVTLASAASLSARFPVLEPPGRLGTAPESTPRGCVVPTDAAAKIRDGGTYENSGMLTLVDLLGPIRRAIGSWRKANHSSIDVRPIVLSIDDDVLGVNGDEAYEKRLFGLLGESASNKRTVDARKRVRSCEFDGVTYLRMSPEPHVGAQAATGWELSQTSRQEDLVESLRAGNDAGSKLTSLQDMLDGSDPPKACRP